MRKRIITAGFIFLFTVILCTLCFISSINITKDLTKNVYEIKENIASEKIDTALIETKTLEKKWFHQSKKLSMFLDHTRIEALDQAITALKTNLEAKRPEDARVEIGKIEKFLEQVKNSETLSISNIL